MRLKRLRWAFRERFIKRRRWNVSAFRDKREWYVRSARDDEIWTTALLYDLVSFFFKSIFTTQLIQSESLWWRLSCGAYGHEIPICYVQHAALTAGMLQVHDFERKFCWFFFEVMKFRNKKLTETLKSIKIYVKNHWRKSHCYYKESAVNMFRFFGERKKNVKMLNDEMLFFPIKRNSLEWDFLSWLS